LPIRKNPLLCLYFPLSDVERYNALKEGRRRRSIVDQIEVYQPADAHHTIAQR
jgi:hypothetical protein